MTKRTQKYEQGALCLLVIFLCIVLTSCGNSAVRDRSESLQIPSAVKPEAAKDTAVLKLAPGASCPAVGIPGIVVMDESQVKPPTPFIVTNFENDIWRKWEAKREITLYKDMDKKSTIVGKLYPGYVIWVVEAQLHTRPARMLVIKDEILDYTPLAGRKFAKGDVMYVLYQYDEDIYRVWHRGVVMYIGLSHVKGTAYYKPTYADSAWGEMQEVAEKHEVVWMKITGPNGVPGWTMLDSESMHTMR